MREDAILQRVSQLTPPDCPSRQAKRSLSVQQNRQGNDLHQGKLELADPTLFEMPDENKIAVCWLPNYNYHCQYNL
jgi:hypothetical protein